MVLRYLRLSIAAAAMTVMLLPLWAQASGINSSGLKTQGGERTLAFYNTHTRETIETTFWRNGDYDQNELAKMKDFLRDHRSGHSHTVSADLLNLLHGLQTELQRRHPDQDIVFHVISGYRSPATNAMLRANGGGQAKKSRHMEGDAIDIRVPGIDTVEIRNVAWCVQRGGVGYYSGSDFVHVDTWNVRSWNWSPKAGMCGRGNS